MLTPWLVTRPAVLQGRHMGSVGVSWTVMLQETQKLSAVSKGQVVSSLFVASLTNPFIHSLKGAIRNTVFEWQFRVPSSGWNGDTQRIPTGIHPSCMLKCIVSYNFVQLIKPYIFSSNRKHLIYCSESHILIPNNMKNCHILSVLAVYLSRDDRKIS